MARPSRGPAARGSREGVGLIPPLAEEGADRGLDAGLVAVPVHAEHDVVAAEGRRWGGNRDPDVVDDARSLDLEDRAGLAAGDVLQAVVVAAGRVEAADAFGFNAFLDAGEFVFKGEILSSSSARKPISA